MGKSKRAVKKDLEKWRINEGDSFDKKLTKVCKLASVNLQRKINASVDNPVRFTQNAVGFKFKRGMNGTVNHIFIKDTQSKYLSHLIDVKRAEVEKMTPLAPNRKNKYGNIPNLGKGKFVKVTHKNGTEILINPNRKPNRKYGTANRVVAVKKKTTRKQTIGSWDKNSADIIRMVKNRMKLK
ncbi:hypothetical protein [Edwardsiella tarda]|uniref:Phage protein n=1 Tax=Edwardsiella tarda TaxID=636 RepID=A0A2A7U7A6_EDWTA|nr:hypothetical protein [Edwardsiella tarda]PEH74123.1 hypothetical protein CRM76_02140 [Edwardsiella tarda]